MSKEEKFYSPGIGNILSNLLLFTLKPGEALEVLVDDKSIVKKTPG